MTAKVEIKLESTPTSPIPNVNKRSSPNENKQDQQVQAIVHILGNILLKATNDIINKKENYAPSSAAITFLFHRMDVNTQDRSLSNDMYSLMTGFMTVYVCFIQVVTGHDFEDFMKLFHFHDSLLTKDSQPFYALNHTCILIELHKQLNTTDVGFILSHIDSIFSKFYTMHFLETSAQKHQKDHGQFYTPQSVIRFMWDKCATTFSLVDYLQHQVYMPRVFDPCLGIGSFLCEFLTRFTKACRFTVWDDPKQLVDLLTCQIPDHVWGIEIDPFAYQLCKINMMMHMFPIYQRLKELGVSLLPGSIHRLRLFCNDSLKLQVNTNPFWKADGDVDRFEQNCLDLLRDASQLKFDFIVTNPPYMIRKTGFITQPDPNMYDETKLGGRGTQAYLYFMWIALQRCDDTQGQVCLITPSQWTVLEFAQHLREWIWEHCKLLDMYEFEPYKVWPKVQTDSLIFRICKRSATLLNSNHTLYLRHTSRRITLTDLLQTYQDFKLDSKDHDPELKYRQTRLTDTNRMLTSKHASFSFIIPTSSCLEELNSITSHLPRLCDGEVHKSNAASDKTPLIWNRGPNTNPVYSLVVRTRWATETFGSEACARWLRPCFYWNGKTMTSATGGGKEGEFWKSRDPLRLSKKETSASEAYWPYCNLDIQQPTISFYSMITINREDAETLTKEYNEQGDASPISALYHYLRQARTALQAGKQDTVEIVHCQYNKCGTDVPVKIVHPINCGYFTRSQPRCRFFVDTTQMAVTNQCIYFTIKPECAWQDSSYFCGLLNSALMQFFIKTHCCYDQQGRMRFFGRLMADIPFAPPPSQAFMLQLATFVQGITVTRTWLYTFLRYIAQGQRLMERVRNYEWHLTPSETQILRQFKPPSDWTFQSDTSLSSCQSSKELQWIPEFVTQQCSINSGDVNEVFVILLKIASLFQLAIDQMVYRLYSIPEALQLELEKELNLTSLRTEWKLETGLQLDPNADTINWCQHILATAISFAFPSITAEFYSTDVSI